MNVSNKRRKYDGLAILSKGYRPFFLGAAIWAVISMFLWVFSLAGMFELPTSFSPANWHIHEMIFGYSGAVIAGFLLTAVPNWTGRFPISGMGLLMLIILWVLGRIAFFFSAYIPAFGVMFIDLLFPIILSLAIAREIIVGKNWRNLRVLAVLVFFTFANLFFHLEMIFNGGAIYSVKFSLVMVLIFIMFIGGRIIPSFTRNWLVRKNLYHLPAQFNRFDIFTFVVSILALIAWVFFELPIFMASFLFIAGILNLIRLYRWAGFKTLNEPMLFILHVGYLFIPLGFFAVAFSIIFPQILNEASAIHLWSAGAVGVMTMAMMSRVSLAHGGAVPQADKIIIAIYISLFLSVLLRFLAGFVVEDDLLLYLSATFWIGGFLIFSLRYWKVLTR